MNEKAVRFTDKALNDKALNGNPANRRAVMLSGSIGFGHDALAEACSNVLEAEGWSTHRLDLMRLLGRGADSIADGVFRSMLAVPGLFDAFHFAALRDGNRLANLADAAATRRIIPRLRGQLDAHPADLAISVFSTGASAFSKIAPQYPSMKHVVFCTDVTPHRLWVHPNVDLYLVTSQAAERAVRRFQPEARVLVVQAPVREPFYHPPTQLAARTSFGLTPRDRCVLLTTGAWGLGPVAAGRRSARRRRASTSWRSRAATPSSSSGCGRSPAASRYIHPFGFTNQIPDLMVASDLVITSSGDTCTEARVIGRPLLLLDVVQGHGRDNLQHELELGDAAVASGRAADVVRATLAALENAKPPPAMPTRSRDAWHSSLTAALATIDL